MPVKPSRPCKYPGCPHLAIDERIGYCETHLRQSRRQQDSQRGNSNQRGYTYRWQQASKHYLIEHPLCVYCLEKKPPVLRSATLVDHYIPHRGNYTLLWDESNWRSSCDECHNIKTAKEDGAFGNPMGRGTKSL
jgi:5-methylcytosine-specific restriction protein A